jgi:photosystem II stability/assembly factor-like uncharacterized protein
MVRRLALGLAVIAPAATARANGRPPQSIGLHVRAGHEADLVLAATFGALFSRDGGDTWRWMCETAIGYGGTFDPDYVVTGSGTVIATTFDGIQVMRDGCSFQLSQFGPTLAATVTAGPDDAIYFAMGFTGDMTAIPPVPADYKIYKSIDGGVSFDAGVEVGMAGDTWRSLEVAPSDPDRIYLTGYRLDGGQNKTLLLYRSDDGGTSYQALPAGPAVFEVTGRSDLEIAAIAPGDPDRVLTRVTWWSPTGQVGDAFYLTTNAGADWAKVLETTDTCRGAVFRANGTDAVIGSARSGIYVSNTMGASFVHVPRHVGGDAAVAQLPSVYCLHERTDGELWACTNNYDPAPFGFGVMKTTDLTTWTGVMRFEDDIVAPVACPDGTIQEDCCAQRAHAPTCPFEITPGWCYLAAQLSISSMPIDCAMPDANVGGDGGPRPSGCCGAGSGPLDDGILAMIAAFGLPRRRRESS